MSLRIDGIVPAPLTAEPDDAELAAHALLASLTGTLGKTPESAKPERGSKEYYQQLSRKIREAHAAETRAAQRYISYTEQRLHTAASSDNLGGSLAELETGLFKHQKTVEREGGDLLKRWQYCMADITMRQMQGVTTK